MNKNTDGNTTNSSCCSCNRINKVRPNRGGIPYSDLIIELKGHRPEWTKHITDRTALSLLHLRFNSIDDVQKAVSKGLQIEDIPNFGKYQIIEVRELLEMNAMLKSKLSEAS
ncbi:hypothetical protein [Psychromonas aquimarina]|uniref:hypothetical protein n=1 Tax=Psychromonas aquimarina TaxID=444919 RepID=UPI00048D3003|nr:hypothetical protein [Psychromonas aquimarina]